MKKIIRNMDFWGCTTSFLCAIHCAVLPVLLSLGLMSNLSFLMHPLVEFCIIVISFFFVYHSLIKRYFTGCVHKSTFYLAVLGLTLVAIHHFLGQYSTLTVVIGGLIIAFSHFQNLYVSRAILLKKS